ncbi:MAG: proline--tRNA ligase [Patescibacteria group bacterium]
MKYSKLFGRTSKTEGSDLKVTSHRLLTQAGYIRESVAGRYFLLPLGLKVHQKISEIVKKHMDTAGAQEMVSPVLHPMELWRETNRDNAAGYELMQIADRRGAEFALGGTGEEMFVDVVRKFNISYRDLPFNIYQFGNKYRDELRARGGLLRVREFVMKDAYSFSTEQQFEAEYQNMMDTYTRIFKEIGLSTSIAEADGGYIGGDYCHEFIVDADVGESVYFTDGGEYIAHEDVAVFDKSHSDEVHTELADLTIVDADRGTTMDDGLKLHAPAPMTRHIKNVVYINERQEIVLACIRGDLDVNETKLQKAADCHHLTPLAEEQIAEWMGSKAGFISAVGVRETTNGHKLAIVADNSLEGLVNGISGANQDKKDYININMARDFTPDIVADIALARAGYTSTDGKELQERVGIEVGNIFQLGYHYTDLMDGATYTDEDGTQKNLYMGCYGIGIGRTMAAIAEVYSDDNGLVWPLAVAPYQVYIASLGDDSAVLELTESVYSDLTSAGYEVLHDDRDVRPGEKFADADLLGIPVRIVVSGRSIEAGGVEIKLRPDKDSQIVPSANLEKTLKKELKRHI